MRRYYCIIAVGVSNRIPPSGLHGPTVLPVGASFFLGFEMPLS